MTSATTRGTRGRVGEGYGLVLFAAVMLLVSSFFDVVALWGLCVYGSRETLEA